MVWYNLKIGSFNLKYTPLKPRVVNYPYCDSEGNVLKKVVKQTKREPTIYINEETQEEHEQVFRLIKNKPMAKLNKTKEVINYKEVDKSEVDDLIIEKQYIVECDELLDNLKTTNKVLKFGFTNGNGFKVFKAYIHTSNLYKGWLFMSLGTTQKSEILLELKEIAKHKQKAKSIELTISGVDKAKVEDLIEI